MGRGVLTAEVQKQADLLLGRELTTKELRLMPYILHCGMNERRVEPLRVNTDERDILRQWRSRWWLSGGASADSLEITEQFWMAASKLVYLAYHAYDKE